MIVGKMFARSSDLSNLPDFATCTISSWGILPFDVQHELLFSEELILTFFYMFWNNSATVQWKKYMK